MITTLATPQARAALQDEIIAAVHDSEGTPIGEKLALLANYVPKERASADEFLSAFLERALLMAEGAWSRHWTEGAVAPKEGVANPKPALQKIYDWTQRQAGNALVQIPSTLAVRALMLFISGPAHTRIIDGDALCILDDRLEFSSEFVCMDEGRRRRLESRLRELKLPEIIRGTPGAPELTPDLIVREVLAAYNLPPVPVLLTDEFRPGIVAVFDPREAAILLNTTHEDVATMTRNLSRLVATLLHEARHAVQIMLVDNCVAARMDCTQSLYKHSSEHPLSTRYKHDLMALYLSAAAVRFHDQTQVLHRGGEDTAFTVGMYARDSGLVERDAHEFSAGIMKMLMDGEVPSIEVAMPDVLTKLAPPPEKAPSKHLTPKEDLSKYGIGDLTSISAESAAVMLRRLHIAGDTDSSDEPTKNKRSLVRLAPSAHARRNTLDPLNSTIMLAQGLNPEDSDGFVEQIVLLKTRLNEPFPGIAGMQLACRRLAEMNDSASLSTAQRRLAKEFKALVESKFPAAEEVSKIPAASAVTNIDPAEQIGRIFSGKAGVSIGKNGREVCNTITDVVMQIRENLTPLNVLRCAALLQEAGLILRAGLVGNLHLTRLKELLLDIKGPISQIDDSNVRNLFRRKVSQLKKAL